MVCVRDIEIEFGILQFNLTDQDIESINNIKCHILNLKGFQFNILGGKLPVFRK